MKRILSLLLALGLLGSLALPFSLASAEPTNLIANPSVETLSGSNPTNWTADKWGGNTTTMTVTGDAHTGNDGLNVTTQKLLSQLNSTPPTLTLLALLTMYTLQLCSLALPGSRIL
jgi:hypothetical protein